MPTKAQLEEQIAQMYSDIEHQRRECEERITDLSCQVDLLKRAVRPFFLPAGSDVTSQQGTAHCPLCNATAPATFKYAPLAGRHVIATARPIEHHKGCLFAEEKSDG